VAPRRACPRLVLALALAAAALPLLAAPASAQGACDVALAVSPARLEHQPGEGLRYNVTATVAQGSFGGDVAFAIEGVTPGWNATVAPATFNDVPAGGSAAAEVLVLAPAAEGPRQAQVSVRATLTCGSGVPVLGVPAPSDTAAQVLAPVLAPAATADGGAAPARPGDDGALGGAGLLLLAAAVLVVGAGVGAALLLRPKGLVVRAADARREMAPGAGASFAVAAENRGRDPVEAAVRILGLPEGWRAISPPGSITLAPGAATTLQVLLRSPPDAAPGDVADVQVQFVERGSGRIRQVDLEARIAGAEHPDVVVRDGDHR
jgi:uncharacterized membrane protein